MLPSIASSSNKAGIAVSSLDLFLTFLYVFQDGSKPCEPMGELMVRSSWGIPIEKFVQSAPQFSTKRAEKQPKNISLEPPSQLLAQRPVTSNLTVAQPVGKTARLIQQQAAATSCTQL
ncbi:hypothetical protein QUA43_04145 [Microcoleus sp. N9_B4]|uniref:hypothetical protein n=1 Tax=Microcoleus sp. N9_B4 TaxID=3055386 RepID=UPI002FD3EDF4